MGISRRTILRGILPLGFFRPREFPKTLPPYSPPICSVVNLYSKNYIANSGRGDELRNYNRRVILFSPELTPIPIYGEKGQRTSTLGGEGGLLVYKERVLDREKHLRVWAGEEKVEITRNIVDQRALMNLAFEEEHKQGVMTRRFGKMEVRPKTITVEHENTTYNIFGFPDFAD